MKIRVSVARFRPAPSIYSEPARLMMNRLLLDRHTENATADILSIQRTKCRSALLLA
jgi:hypothetical protein